MQLTLCSEKSDGGTVSASTTSSTNAVNIVLRVVGVIIVEHMGNVANILKSEKLVKIKGKANDDHDWIA